MNGDDLERLAAKAMRRAREYRSNVDARARLERAARRMLTATARALVSSLGATWVRDELAVLSTRVGNGEELAP